jgi:ankyrin repeat protein
LPIFLALLKNLPEIFKILLEKKVEISEELKKDLILAALEYDYPEILDLLIAHLAIDIDQFYNVTDNKRQHWQLTALQIAINKQSEKVAELLLAAGANPNLSTCNSQLPIFLALSNDLYKMAKALFKKGVEISEELKKDLTMTALKYSYSKSLNVLIKDGGIDIDQVYNIPTDEGEFRQTALMIAVCKKDYEIINKLIDLGAKIDKDVEQQNGGKFSAIDLATAMSNPKMVNLLESKAAEQLQSTTEIYNPVASTAAELPCTTEIPSPVVSKAKSAQENKEQKER